MMKNTYAQIIPKINKTLNNTKKDSKKINLNSQPNKPTEIEDEELPALEQIKQQIKLSSHIRMLSHPLKPTKSVNKIVKLSLVDQIESGIKERQRFYKDNELVKITDFLRKEIYTRQGFFNLLYMPKLQFDEPKGLKEIKTYEVNPTISNTATYLGLVINERNGYLIGLVGMPIIAFEDLISYDASDTYGSLTSFGVLQEYVCFKEAYDTTKKYAKLEDDLVNACQQALKNKKNDQKKEDIELKKIIGNKIKEEAKEAEKGLQECVVAQIYQIIIENSFNNKPKISEILKEGTKKLIDNKHKILFFNVFTRLHESGQLSALVESDGSYNKNIINGLIDKLTGKQAITYLKLIRSLALVFIESARNNVIREYLIEQEYVKYLDEQKQAGLTNNQLVNNLPIYTMFAKEDISGGVKDLATSYTQIFAYVENDRPKELTNLMRLVKVSMHNVNSLMNIYGLGLNLFNDLPQKATNKHLRELSSAIQPVLEELKLDPASFNKMLGWAQQTKTNLYKAIEFMVPQEQNDLIGKIELMVPQE